MTKETSVIKPKAILLRPERVAKKVEVEKPVHTRHRVFSSPSIGGVADMCVTPSKTHKDEANFIKKEKPKKRDLNREA